MHIQLHIQLIEHELAPIACICITYSNTCKTHYLAGAWVTQGSEAVCMPPAGLNLGSVTGLQNQLTGVLLQHVLVNATSAAQLVAVGQVNSALGAILNASYPVTIKRAGSNVSAP